MPDGRIVSGSIDNTLRVWDPVSGATLHTFEGHAGWVGSVAVLPDGRLVSGSEDKSLRLWDPDSGECFRVLEGHTDSISGVAGLPNGRVVSGSKDNTLRAWDADSGLTIALLDLEAWITVITVTADGLIAAGDVAGRVHFLRLEEPAKASKKRGLRGFWRGLTAS
jgi:WD40 repeat protein